jgi:hypothetical protein
MALADLAGHTMTIVIYHPSKARLGLNDTKVAADRGSEQGGAPGHYFSCDECGWCSRTFTGEDSRLRAVSAAAAHQLEKARAAGHRAFMIPSVREITRGFTTGP